MSIDSTELRFPDDFVWGAATAAYQIEGAVDVDGRGNSIWDTFSHEKGRTYNGDTGDVACDHYRRVEEDLELIARLGLKAYRFSIAWPRIQPDGKGPANQAGLDFYRRLVDGLRRRDVLPVATLYHWDLPQALEDAGGWTERDTTERFADYAAIAVAALADDVGMWITINEPWCAAWLGYGHGRHAPGRRDIGEAVAATHHLLLAHGRAVPVLRAGGATEVGITLNLSPFTPATADPADIAAARRADGNLNRLFLDPILRGSYPDDVVAHHQGRRPGFSVVGDGDLEAISAPIDFLGVNYYEPGTVSDPSQLDAARASGRYVKAQEPDPVSEDLRAVHLAHPEARRTEMGWEVHPSGLRELLLRLRRDYSPPPIYVTENGAAYCDYVAPDGSVRDPERIGFIDGHVRAVHAALSEGVDVRGYFVWSLMDNFEWGFGYAKRFGLIWIDYATGSRLPKASFHWYRSLITANTLS